MFANANAGALSPPSFGGVPFGSFVPFWLTFSTTTPTDNERDARLVKAAQKNANDYRHLVQLHQDRVFATALRFVHDASDANDIAQDAFIKAYKHLGRFEAGKRFSPWVCTIASNLAKDHLRKKQRRFRNLFAFKAEPKAPQLLVEVRKQDDENTQLADRLKILPPKLKEAVVLRFVSGLSILEICDALSISESAAKMRLKRALELLRENESAD